MEEIIKDNQLVEETTDVVENVTEETENVVTDATDCDADEAGEDADEAEEGKAGEKKLEVEPLPEQKPFLMSPYERAILNEMERRATENPSLAEGLKDKDKSIGECFAFVTNRAKKMATSNCAMIADSEVYAWAQFYYTQRREIISLELKPAPKPTTQVTAAKTKTDTKASSKVKKETPKAEKSSDKKEAPAKADPKAEKAVGKDKVHQEEGKDGKVYTITEFGLF